eukprot:XP_011660961.1 PREDICTED: uncharacterized protein LOC105436755 [Strongylocentrotus purpuratus]
MTLWNCSKNVKISEVAADLGLSDALSETDTYDVTTADLDRVISIPMQIPRVWHFEPGQLTTQITQHKLDLVTKRIRDLNDTLGLQPYACTSSILVMMVDKLSRAHRSAVCLYTILEAERRQAEETQGALQKQIEELETGLEEERRQATSSKDAQQKHVDELESRLEDEKRASRQAQDELLSHLSKHLQTSGTQTDNEISVPSSSSSQEVDPSAAISEEIFYDALTTIDDDQAPDISEDIFYDALSTIGDNQSGARAKEIFYDALTTIDDNQSGARTKEIFYDAFSTSPRKIPPVFIEAVDALEFDAVKAFVPWSSLRLDRFLDKTIEISNSDLDAAKATPKSKGKAKAGTIVKRMRDLVPFREPNSSIELGSGTAGTVYLYRHAKTNEPVALKVIALPPSGVDGNKKSAIEKLQNEMKILQRLGCTEWFPEFYGCCKVCKDVVGIAMEFCGDVEKGESYSILNCIDGKGPKLDKDAWMNVMLDIADGLTVMHKKGFLCNDLKEDNVLLVKSGGEWRAKIIDFGWSSDMNMLFPACRMPFTARQKRDYKYRHAYNYIAPECALKGKSFSQSSDVYSLGRLAAFVGQEVPGLKELGDYGFNIYSSPRGKRPSLQKFSQEINYLRSRTNESDSDEDLV